MNLKQRILIISTCLFVMGGMFLYTISKAETSNVISDETNNTKQNSYEEEVFQGKYPTYPKAHYGKGAHAEQVMRGEYLSILGDCIACHTKPGGIPFAGGLAIKTPFGTIYSPNITPDKETGIGNWTTEQFIKAMREGISPSGHYYYPAFPYTYFNLVTDQDLTAIKAYLNAIPPVSAANQKNQLVFPLSWRFLQLGWRTLFFHKMGPFKPDSTKSPDWNRGAYIVEGLGHCGMCHTPMYYLFSKKWVLGAPIQKYKLSGAFVEGYYAPNITHSNLKDVPMHDLDDVFLQDRLIGGGVVQGPMAEANHDSLRYLTLADIRSIGTYLKSVKSKEQPKPRVGSGLSAGKKIFEMYCAACHTTGAGGAPKIGDEAIWGDKVMKLGINQLYTNAINGIGGMPPKGTCTSCSNQDIENAVQYIVAESKPGVGQILGLTKEKPPKPLTLGDGERIYLRYCKACHDGSYQGAPIVGDKEHWEPLIKSGIEKLILHSIDGYKNMPAKGSCSTCSDAEIIAAVIYMVEMSKTSGDYRLWLSE